MADRRFERACTSWWWAGGLIGVAGLAVVAGVLLWQAGGGGAASGSGAADVRVAAPAVTTAATKIVRRETRPTLDPARFVGKARLAHQVAREIPGVLDRLYCYCECDKHRGHKSLLSCYVDSHAAT
jgi:hypothetical protein